MVGLDLWVKIENGQVVSRPNKLPADVQTWGADKDALIRSGWYPIESVKPETFADATEVWESESFDIESDTDNSLVVALSVHFIFKSLSDS